jgi:PAS domain S-box-containing protein
MKARTTFLVASGVLLLALIAGFYLGSRPLLVRPFANEEKKTLQTLVPVLEGAVQSELNHLDMIARDQSYWSDTCEFIQDTNRTFVSENLYAAAFASLKINLLAILSSNGQPIVALMFDPRTSRLSSAVEPLTDASRPDGPLGTHFATPTFDGVQGVLSLGEELMLVAIRPVFDAQLRESPLGFVVVGRRLTGDDVCRRLATLLPAGSSDRVFVRRQTHPAATLNESSITPSPAGDSQRITLRLRDLGGAPAAELSATVHYPFTALAHVIFMRLLLLVSCGSLLAMLALWLVEDVTVLEPLSRLADQVRAIRRGETAKRIGWSRRDELGEVAQELDHLLSLLETEHAAVIESEQHNRALVEANPDALLVIDRSGVILDAKAENDADLGCPVSALVCHGLEALGLDAAERTRFQERLTRALGTGRMQVMEFRRLQPDGAPFWGEARMVRLDPNRVLAIIRNITERRRSEEERERFDDRVAQIQKFESLGVLASGIAHDFNNILSAIVGHAEQAQLNLTNDSPLRDPIDRIIRASMRASALTRQMLNYAGQGACDFQPLNLNHLLSEMLQLLRTSLSKQARLDVSLAHDLPLVQGDAAQLWQVAMNLLTNASDALGGQPGTVRLTTRTLTAGPAELAEFLGTAGLQAGVYAMVEVADTGCGMSEETLVRIFDPFFSTRAAGRGLGLSAVLGILKSHGGGICVHSQPGQGSTFQVIFPAVSAPPSAAAPVPPAQPLPTAPPPNRKLVLLADDEPDIRRLMTLLVRSAGWDVLAAAHGREAVDLFHQHADQIRLVFLDEEMPELNGHAVLQIIRRQHPNLAVVIVSGHGGSACAQRFADLHPTAILDKPFRREELMAILNQVTPPSPPKET